MAEAISNLCITISVYALRNPQKIIIRACHFMAFLHAKTGAKNDNVGWVSSFRHPASKRTCPPSRYYMNLIDGMVGKRATRFGVFLISWVPAYPPYEYLCAYIE